MANRLSESRSPYLRQHAHQPVDWMPWGDEAFAEAQRRKVPVFLSVGYSSCHWCHVMAHESFDQPDLAAFLNRHFVSIKLDREEYPDVDEAYMTAVQLSSGRGGWPMSVFLTPDRKPFFAGTYFPLRSVANRIGFTELTARIADLWQTQREDLLRTADEFAVAIRQARSRPAPSAPDLTDAEVLDAAVEALREEFDPRYAGFGGAPKFPPHTALRFLLAYAREGHRHADEARRMALATLHAIVRGGIHDHVAGGFHRYSTDERWFLPHFEKMAYDNAQLLENLTEAARQSPEPESAGFLRAAKRLQAWVRRELTDASGLVLTARDADSLDAHGHLEEGAFLTWTPDETTEVLSTHSHAFDAAWGIIREGNFHDEATGRRTGRNIPVPADGVDPAEWDVELSLLLRQRSTRPAASLDDKAIASSNGLMAEALIRAGDVQAGADLLAAWSHLADERGGLPHQVTHGVAEIAPYLDDLAAMALAYAALARATGSVDADQRAQTLAQVILREFWHEDHFSLTSSHHDDLFGRAMPVFDGPTPSASALAIRALLATGHTDSARRALDHLRGWMSAAPTATEGLLLGLLQSTARSTADDRAPIRWIPAPDGTSGRIHVSASEGWHVQAMPGIPPAQLVPNDPPLSIGNPEPAPDGWVISVQAPGWVRPDHSLRVVIQRCTETECQPPIERTFRWGG